MYMGVNTDTQTSVIDQSFVYNDKINFNSSFLKGDRIIFTLECNIQTLPA